MLLKLLFLKYLFRKCPEFLRLVRWYNLVEAVEIMKYKNVTVNRKEKREKKMGKV